MPYGLFDYTPDSTIHTMGLTPKAPITTKMLGEECPQAMPPACKPGFTARITGYSTDGCRTPRWMCEPTKPQCPTTLTQGGCNYRLV